MARYGNHPRTKEFHDWGKTYKAFSQALLGAGQALNQIALDELYDVAEGFLRDQDAQWPHSSSGRGVGDKNVKNGALFGGDAAHPWYSGQLHDSVAVRIAQGNRTVSVHYMPASATMPPGEPGIFLDESGAQTMGRDYRHIVGADWARTLMNEKVPYYFLPGVQVQLLIGVPYTDMVNASQRHRGFADNLAGELTSAVNQWVFDGGLTRNVVVATDKGAKVVKRSNVRRK